MAFSVFQAGSTLYGVDPRGSIATLALPANVTLDKTLRPRFAVLGRFAVMTNSPSRPLSIDANLNVRVLCPAAPAAKMTLSGVAGGALSGTFQARQTYIVLDQFGNLIAESDFGPTAAAFTITTNYLKASGIDLSSDAVSASRLYRTTTGTATYFQWIDVDGNTQTTIQDDLSDAGLSTVSASSLGTPPNLYLICEFKGRLFGVSKADTSRLRYSEINAGYAWPSLNTFQMPLSGSDTRGLTGLVRRRDALGIGRTNALFQLSGTGSSDFRIVIVSENCGIEAPDSVAVFRNTAFFLWKDGVYRWDDAGLKSVSDGRVSRWFTRNGTFNLARLKYAFAQIDPVRKRYRLFLAASGTTTENCWVEYDFINDRWWGPHMSHAANPSAAFTLYTNSGLAMPLIGGSDGFLRVDRRRRVDDDTVGIDYDVVTTRETVGDPDNEKVFGELSVEVKPEATGTLDVYATVGELDAPRAENTLSTPAFSYDLTQGRQRLGRVGQGKAFKLRFRNNRPNEDVALRGFELPITLVGKR